MSFDLLATDSVGATAPQPWLLGSSPATAGLAAQLGLPFCFAHFFHDGEGCAIPQEWPGFGALLERLRRLPGFDNGAVIGAMGCTDDDRFVCWRSPGG